MHRLAAARGAADDARRACPARRFARCRRACAGGAGPDVQVGVRSARTSNRAAPSSPGRGPTASTARGRPPYVPPVGPGVLGERRARATSTRRRISRARASSSRSTIPRTSLRAGSRERSRPDPEPSEARGVKTLPAVNMAGHVGAVLGSDPAVRAAELERVSDRRAAAVRHRYRRRRCSRTRGPRRATRANLTPEQRAIALYWADNAGESGTPVGHWISIASQMVSERRLSAEDAARLMVLTSLAQADAFIATWGYKYQYNLIRPRTYIRRVIDSTWEPLIPTPPFPEYPSGHSTVSAAAATVLTSVLGDGAFERQHRAYRSAIRCGGSIRSGRRRAKPGMSRDLRRHSFPVRQHGRPRARRVHRREGRRAARRRRAPVTTPRSSCTPRQRAWCGRCDRGV